MGRALYSQIGLNEGRSGAKRWYLEHKEHQESARGVSSSSQRCSRWEEPELREEKEEEGKGQAGRTKVRSAGQE